MAEKPEMAAPQAPIQAAGDQVRDQDKVMLVLAYLGILSLIPYLTVKDSEYVKWHARQGLALFLFWVCLVIVGVIPIIGQIVACLGFLLCLVLVIVGIIKAFKPERWRIPGIASVADKLPL